ncbi:hypothetical protein QYE76_045630 [Lolium multiflorum]|uniref:Reverse transcriptase Ty1/copia-type domain-containing protein n=1 Tax=Lolium multiflorum TaxID=4521 RepID=A0AAD8WXN4_LOLMU|nr:hypothetical protein QYE76_045630 [Lolium multiflorum]
MVEPSSSQHQQTPSLEANDAPTQEQEQNPPSSVQDQGQDQSRIHDGSDEYPFNILLSPNNVQDQAHDDEHSQEIEEAQVEGQDGDPNDQVDQVKPPRPRRTKEEIEARRLARRDRNLEILEHTHEKVLSDVRGRVSTRRQLANFSNHHAYISLVEPKKVFEALEDPDWLEAMHDELNNFKRNKVWTLVEKPKECRNVIVTKWIFKNKQDYFGIVVRNKARLVAQEKICGAPYGGAPQKFGRIFLKFSGANLLLPLLLHHFSSHFSISSLLLTSPSPHFSSHHHHLPSLLHHLPSPATTTYLLRRAPPATTTTTSGHHHLQPPPPPPPTPPPPATTITTTTNTTTSGHHHHHHLRPPLPATTTTTTNTTTNTTTTTTTTTTSSSSSSSSSSDHLYHHHQ